MQIVEYRRWSPPDSPVQVEFPADLLTRLGDTEASGILYGSRNGGEIRIVALQAWNEQAEKVGVFVSRIRGEVFLTETDLEFLHQQEAELALVIAGDQAGFFVRESDGSLQTVRSHEEFGVEPQRVVPPVVAAPKARPMARKRTMRWAPAGVAALAALPVAALAVLPQRVFSDRVSSERAFLKRTAEKPTELEVHEIDGQLRISWAPGRNAVLVIEDGGRRLATPVFANQSNLTYVPRESQVEVSLLTTNSSNQPSRESTLFISSRDHQANSGDD